MRNMKILLVEDNPADAQLIQLALKDSGASHNILIAQDGEMGLEMLKNESPDLILLDLNLPKKSGLEFLNEMKQDIDFRSTPVVVLTNSSSRSDVSQAYKNNCNAYIRKAVGFEELVEALDATQKFWFEVVTLSD